MTIIWNNLYDEQEYLYAKNDYDTKRINLEIDSMNFSLSKAGFAEVPIHNENKYLTAFRRFMDTHELSREMLTALVHSIELKSDKHIHIQLQIQRCL